MVFFIILVVVAWLKQNFARLKTHMEFGFRRLLVATISLLVMKWLQRAYESYI